MIQQFFFSLHEFLDSLNLRVVFLLIISAFIFAIYFSYIVFIKKRFHKLTDTKKVLFSIMALLSFLIIMDLIAAYGIYSNLEPEVLARSFAESICSGKIDNTICKNNNKILATDYFANFINTWRPNSSQFSNWFDHREYYDNWRNSLHKIDEHYTNIDYYETYNVVYRISPITLPFTEFDLLFDIRLRKRIVQSRFLGSYERWRVTHFGFKKIKSDLY